MLWEPLFWRSISSRNSQRHRFLLTQDLTNTLCPHLPQLCARAPCSPSWQGSRRPQFFLGRPGAPKELLLPLPGV